MTVDPYLAREIFFIELWHLGALSLSLAVNRLFFRKARKGPLLSGYLRLQGALLLWIVSKILKTVSPVIGLRWFFISAQYLGVSFLGPLFLGFAWQYRFSKAPPRNLIRILSFVSLGFFLFIVSNPLHHLFYATFTFRWDSFGPGYYVFLPVTYLQILIGLVLCFLGVFRRSLSWGDLSIGMAAILPLGINVAYSFQLFEPMFDPTPLAMTASLIFFGFAAFRSRFLGLLPVARTVLVETMTEPMILTDRKGRVLWSRNLPPGSAPRETLRTGGRIFRLHHRTVGPRDRFYLYQDVTDLVLLREGLEEKNRLLEESNRAIESRNRETLRRMESDLLDRSRRDLHDILGHSLTMGLFLLRRARIRPAEEADLRRKVRDQLEESLKGLQQRLRAAEEPRLGEESVLSIALQPLLERGEDSPVEVGLHISGREEPLDGETAAQLVQCCREAVTNSVRHGRARRADISLFYLPGILVAAVTDDGAGCADLRYGNGLGLMEKALSRMGACLKVWSEPGQGFQLSIRLELSRREDPFSCRPGDFSGTAGGIRP